MGFLSASQLSVPEQVDSVFQWAGDSASPFASLLFSAPINLSLGDAQERGNIPNHKVLRLGKIRRTLGAGAKVKGCFSLFVGSGLC